MITDEALMRQAKEGDMHCVSELFMRHNKDLYSFFLSNCKDDSLSKDLVQNVFERIIKYRSKYKEEFPFKPWLFKLAWNEQNDYYRKKRITLPGDEQIKYIMPKHEEVIDNKQEQKQRLKIAMSKLTSEQQQLLQMTQYQGLRYAEVADIMHCSLSAIKVRVHRTMKLLRAEYQKTATS